MIKNLVGTQVPAVVDVQSERYNTAHLNFGGGGTLEALLKPIFKGKHKAFTLAEMMVVMLILSIVLAAMAPVVTTRSKVDQSSPWKYSEGNLSDAYYGLGESQTAMIGQREFINTDETAKLIINSNSTRPSQIAFKRDAVNQGVLRLNNNSVLLGKLSASGSLGSNAVAIGNEVNAGQKAVVIGDEAEAIDSGVVAIGSPAKSSGDGSVVIGVGGTTGKYSISVGTLAVSMGENAVAIGTPSMSYGNSVAFGAGSQANSYGTALGASTEVSSYGTAIGYDASANKSKAISIGNSSYTNGESAVAIGQNTYARSDDSIAINAGASDRGATGLQSISIGNLSKTGDDYALAIGAGAQAKSESGVALGYNATAEDESTIAIGTSAKATSFKAETHTNYPGIAIGLGAESSGGIAIGNNGKFLTINTGNTYATTNGIAIGNNAKASGAGNVAIGVNACSGVTGNNKTCIGSNSGPKSTSHKSDTTLESLYFGSGGSFNRDSVSINETNAIFELHKKGDYAMAILNADLIVQGYVWQHFAGKSGHGDAIGRGHSKTWGNELAMYNDSVPEWPYSDMSSDRRLKYVGRESTSGLDKIRLLKVFNYTFKKDETKEPRVGVMAQDLQKIFPDAVKKGEDGFLRIRMEDMFYAVINAIKELDTRVTALEKENAELKIRLEKLEAKIK